MSKPTGTVLSLPAFLGGSRRLRHQTEVIHPIPHNDLEVLAEVIKTMRSHKIIADADLMKAESRMRDAEVRVKEAQGELNEAIDAYEAEVAERGLLCRK